MDNENKNKETNPESVPYIVYEGEMARNERNIKRLIITISILAALLFGSNAVWLWAWMQYDYTSESTTTEVSIDGKDGIANYIGNDGDIVNNGENNSKESENKANQNKENK